MEISQCFDLFFMVALRASGGKKNVWECTLDALNFFVCGGILLITCQNVIVGTLKKNMKKR